MKHETSHASELRILALQVHQSRGRVLYSFAIDGKLVPQFATVSRVRRNGASLEGYQRPEVLSHIAEIRAYLEGDAPMIPNAVVIAFDSRVTFEPAPDADLGERSPYSVPGTLVIPVGEWADED